MPLSFIWKLFYVLWGFCGTLSFFPFLQIQTLLTEKVKLEKDLRILNDKLSSALSECDAKDELVKDHAKMAQEAIAGDTLWFFPILDSLVLCREVIGCTVYLSWNKILEKLHFNLYSFWGYFKLNLGVSNLTLKTFDSLNRNENRLLSIFPIMTSEHMKNCKWCVLERLILDPQLKMMLFWNLLKKLLNNQK